MNPEVDNNDVTVYRTPTGLLTVPKIGRNGAKTHAISSTINGTLAHVVSLHDSLPGIATTDLSRARSLLNDGRAKVTQLTAAIQALRANGGPIDAVRTAEVANRELSGSLEKLASRLKLETWRE